MPKSDVTRIKSVSALLVEEFGDKDVLDPFRPQEQRYALDRLRSLPNDSEQAVLLRPPTSFQQAADYIRSHGMKWDGRTTWWAMLKDEVSRVTANGAVVISVGWDSNGLGQNRWFNLERILLVGHGSHWHDSIVTVERKRMTQDEWHRTTPMGFVPDAIVGF
jgi:hypothetical protein